MTAARPAVYDCNVLLGAILSTRGANYACVELVMSGRVTLILSSKVLLELRRMPDHKDLKRFKSLTVERIDALVARLLPRAMLIDDIPARFEYARDPDDAHYVNLALAANAVYVVSRDKDLSDLMNAETADAVDFRGRFPHLRILEPREFLEEMRTLPS